MSSWLALMQNSIRQIDEDYSHLRTCLLQAWYYRLVLKLKVFKYIFTLFLSFNINPWVNFLSLHLKDYSLLFTTLNSSFNNISKECWLDIIRIRKYWFCSLIFISIEIRIKNFFRAMIMLMNHLLKLQAFVNFITQMHHKCQQCC